MSRTVLFLVGGLALSLGVNFYLFVELASGSSMFANLGQENHAIQNVTNIVSTLGALLAVVGLLLGVDQLRQNREQARAQAVYNALKDIREASATATNGFKFNMYYALWEQKQRDVFDDALWGPVRIDIANTLTDQQAKDYWAAKKGNFPEKFRTEIDQL